MREAVGVIGGRRVAHRAMRPPLEGRDNERPLPDGVEIDRLPALGLPSIPTPSLQLHGTGQFCLDGPSRDGQQPAASKHYVVLDG